MRKSIEFEQLVAKIVGELEPTAVVTWDDHIVGSLSGRRRQIDVSIRRQEMDFLGVIDAKDYRRPATIERVDALTGVMRDVGAQYGALVCSGGFAKTIHEYARRCGISLFNAHDAQSISWALELRIPIVWTELTPIVRFYGVFALETGDQVVTNDPRGPQVTTDGGMTLANPLGTFERAWNGGALSRTPGIHHHVSSDRPVQAVVLDTQNQVQLRPVENFELIYTIEARTWLGKFTPDECRGLVDFLDGQVFYASFLPDSSVPLERDPEWDPVQELAQLALTARGTVAVCTAPVLLSDGTMGDLSVAYAGPIDPPAEGATR